jgi:hypothetical protein
MQARDTANKGAARVFSPLVVSGFPAIGLGRGFYNYIPLHIANEASSQEGPGDFLHLGEVLPVIFPIASRTRSRARRQLVNAATLRVNHGSTWRIRAKIIGIQQPVTVAIDRHQVRGRDIGTNEKHRLPKA